MKNGSFLNDGASLPAIQFSIVNKNCDIIKKEIIFHTFLFSQSLILAISAAMGVDPC